MKSDQEPTAQQVLEVLRGVREPELNKDIVTLQMVKDVSVSGSAVSLLVTVLTPGTQAEIEDAVRKQLAKL